MNAGVERIIELVKSFFIPPYSIDEYVSRLLYLFKQFVFKYAWRKYLESSSLLSQIDLINASDWDILIVLDACRFDAFREIFPAHLSGRLLPVVSSGSITLDWFFSTWCENVKLGAKIYYISANPFIRGSDFRVRQCVSRVIDAWKIFWNSKRMTVDANTVLNYSRLLLKMNLKSIGEGELKFVIHLLQPHAPYLFWPTVFEELWKLGAPYNISTIFSLFQRNRSVVAVLWDSYLASLSNAVRAIARFANNVKRSAHDIRIVVTSDHGELFGEYGLLFHPNIRVPELRIVPWFIVD